MAVQAKICGISTPETLDAALAGGASHIGFVFFSKSPRHVSLDQAAALVERMAGRALSVALFVDPDADFVAQIMKRGAFDVAQFHGEESPAFVAQSARQLGVEVWKAVPVRTRADLDLAASYQGAATRILYDAKPPKAMDLPGGTGLRFDWALLDGFSHPLPWILAGGLDPENVSDAVSRTSARFVDVSSGVESAPGIKDVDKISTFLKATHSL